MHFPGSRQVGLGKRVLERYPWWRFELHPEWVSHVGEGYFKPIESYIRPFAAGIPG